jgi:hypothetical protein
MRAEQGIIGEEQARDALERVGNKHDGVVIAKAFQRFLLRTELYYRTVREQGCAW